MAINFSIGEYVIINRAYVEKILATSGVDPTTLQNLGYIGANPSEVLALGSVPAAGTVQSFIKVRPMSNKNPAYRGNQGVTLYFINDTQLNNSLELSTAFIDDKCFVKAQNVSGGIITKGQLVYQSGFDGVLQLPNVGVADATSATTCAVLGIASADIAIAECGSILIEGSFNGLDTSGFANVGATVYLSDTPGEISATPGSNEKVVARVASIDAVDGSIILDSITAGTGGGGGGAGATGIQGNTGILGLQGATGISAGGGGGFFSDGTGTNAGIGKGTVAPTAAGENSLAQGDNSSVTEDNSFAFGDSVTNTGITSTAFGENITISGNRSFASGGGITQAALDSFAHGYACYAEGSGFTGSGKNVNFGNYVNTYSADRSFNHGYINFIYGGYNVFASGTNILLGDTAYTGAYNTFAQGDRIQTQSGSGAPLNANSTFLQGNYLTTTGGTFANIIQGSSIDTSNYTVRSIIHGARHTSLGTSLYDAIVSGYQHQVENDTSNILVQGYENHAAGSQLFLQGRNNTWNGTTHANIFAQGRDVDFTGSQQAYQIFAQGYNLSVGGEATNIFMQGYDMQLDIRGENSFFQGSTHEISDVGLDRVFIQGRKGRAVISDQKVWASNRDGSAGDAQSSKIVKAFTTVNATTFSFGIPTDTDKSYTLTVKAVARNTTTNGESASFVLSQALAYNDTGTAVLVGAPTFTQVDSGGGAAAWSMGITTSVADIDIQYTGDASDTVQWCIEIDMVEVAG